MEFSKVCNEIKARDAEQLQSDLNGSDMKKRNRAQYILIESASDEVKKDILSSLDDVLSDKKEMNDSVLPSGPSFNPFPVNTDDPVLSNSPLPESPQRGGKGRGKGARPQSTLQLDNDNITKVSTPKNARRLKILAKVAHHNYEDFMLTMTLILLTLEILIRMIP